MITFTHALGKEQYKVVTEQNNLNDLIEKELLPKSKNLRRLKLVITPRNLHIRGVVFEPDMKLKSIRPGDIFFDITLAKDEISADEVRMAIKKFKIYNPKKRIDLWKLIHRYSNSIRRRIMVGLTGPTTPFFDSGDENSLLFDLKFILKRIPTEASLLGQIAILNVGLERRRLVWYIESSVVLKSILDYLGPRYLQVEKVDVDLDAIRLLTDLNLEE